MKAMIYVCMQSEGYFAQPKLSILYFIHSNALIIDE